MKLNVKPFHGKLGIAVSGGMDSMVLLDLYRKTKTDIVVINIEHGIRGEESILDSDFVAKYCRLAGIECYLFSVDTLRDAKQGESLELAARRLRYQVFDRLLAEKKVNAIALAHHADDNAETILMRIFRGTGVRGLIGINERKGYIRPILGYSHTDIEKYAVEHAIPYVTDSTNLVDDCTRNYIRHEIIPKIKILYPNVIDAFTRLSENAREVDSYLTSIAPTLDTLPYGYVMKNCFGYPEILQKYAIKKFFESVGVFQDIEKKHLDILKELGKKPNNTAMDLPFGFRALRYKKDLFITCEKPKVFRKTPFDEDKTYSFGHKTFRFVRKDKIEKGCTLAPEKIPEDAVLRTRKDGDMFYRVNGKNKLLSDFLNEKKLNAFEKENLLLLASGSTVLAILGVETAEQVKCEIGNTCLVATWEQT